MENKVKDDKKIINIIMTTSITLLLVNIIFFLYVFFYNILHTYLEIGIFFKIYIFLFVIFIISGTVNIFISARGQRKAEFLARKTLDDSPFQWARIENELKNGVISEEIAKENKKNNQLKLDFSGALDGCARLTQKVGIVLFSVDFCIILLLIIMYIKTFLINENYINFVILSGIISNLLLSINSLFSQQIIKREQRG
jgi:flagellar biosynthesis component FlhA